MAELGCCRSDLLLVFGLCSARNWPDIPEPLPVAIAWDLGLNGGAARFPRGFPCSHGSTHAVCTLPVSTWVQLWVVNCTAAAPWFQPVVAETVAKS